MEKTLRFAAVGCGFWADFQICGWKELAGVELVALCNRTRAKAEALAAKHGVPQVYARAAELFVNERLDFVDIITAPETHEALVLLAAEHRVPVICQKPMSTSYASAEKMVAACAAAGVPFFVHENHRWQLPTRKLKEMLDSGVIGHPFRARLSFSYDFPVWENQPYLAQLEQFILADVGPHVLDVTRFLFGEVQSVYGQTARIHSFLKGEDVATVTMRMRSGMHCTAEMSFASIVEEQSFPEILVWVEGTAGSAALLPGFVLKTTTKQGTQARRLEPPSYPWADPAYAVSHASIVDTNRDILRALRGEKQAETTGADNLKTLRLVFAAYESARDNALVTLGAGRAGGNNETGVART
ncbi:MAG: Gfo/Idh/MocA family oxidoreductase [Kiritimatiellae bacterium]|nr:Gfo/Idh/MocA family oxidoreductase [Kiritimatiellia bacterium]